MASIIKVDQIQSDSGNVSLTGNVTTSSSSVVNFGSGQFYKDTNGNVGIGTSSPLRKLSVSGAGVFNFTSGSIEIAEPGTVPGFAIQTSTTNQRTDIRNTAGNLVFTTGTGATTERLRITSGGDVLVGQTSGSYKLSVTGTVYLDNRKSTVYNASSAATLGVFGASNDTSVNNGAVYNIEWLMSGNASGQFWYANYLARGGSRTLGAYCTGTTWTNASDIANKEAIAPIGYGLETVMAANPVDFRWKTMTGEDGLGKKDIGFIAQDMELIVPEVVTGGEGQKGISYGSLVAVAFKAIQEQQAIITALTARVESLEGAQE
jgi:hypothetical protein